MSESNISMEDISSHFHSETESEKPSKNTQANIKPNIDLLLEDISSGSISETESEKLTNNIRATRKAETILRKNIINMKDIIREQIDTSPAEFQIILNQLEDRIGRGEKASDLAAKLQQFSDKIINTIKARDAAFEELKEVRDEGTEARKALKEHRKK
uniref:Uncharacterized protein n=1 Tax=Panagrolaimus sp. PS1159 TaxID=55785 RepID=A0AC35GCG3_9BILA